MGPPGPAGGGPFPGGFPVGGGALLRALRFVLKGKRAHFRRFYTNSSALTYPVPPPSALQGLLGAALGLGPEYTEVLSGLYLSVRPSGAQRHLFQTVNYLLIKEGKLEELRGLHKEGRTQIPLQFLVGEGGRPVAFEVWVASEDAHLLRRLAGALEAPSYPLSLGSAFALAWAEEVGLFAGEVVRGWEGEGLGWWEVARLHLKNPPPGTQVYRDRFPVLLGPGRAPKRVEELALEVRGAPLPLAYEGEVLLVEGGAWGVVRV
ncbi:CRISPR-associated protein Cas5 [Thermus thermophilus]|uniref:CRISPR-associated protein Cas5 n=1 Tax=Thermus thermophilus TaxID=274 RepID=UPI0009DBEE0C